MRLGIRFAVLLAIPLVTLTVVFGAIYNQRSRVLLREELEREGRAIARVVQVAVEDYLRERQLEDLHELVDRITGYERVLGMRIFDQHGLLIHQSPSLEPYPFIHHATLQRVLQHNVPAEMRRHVGDQPVVGFIFPLDDVEGRLAGAVQVLQLESFIAEDARANRDFIFALTVAMVVATVVIVLLVTRLNVTRPIEELVQSFREVSAEALPARVPVRSHDELGMLAREFNGMCERLDSAQSSLVKEQERRRQVETRLRNAERLAGLGRLAAGLAHEIGTPLNVISGRTEALQRALAGNSSGGRHLRIIVGQIDRIVRIVRDMLDFARMKEPRRVPTDVAVVLRRVLELMENQLEKANIRVEYQAATSLPQVTADPDQLQQVFLNLILNATHAMSAGGELRVRIEPRSVARPERSRVADTFLAIEFEDTGRGIAPEHQNHVFDPFFTTKEAGEGTGLGLSVSYGIVQEHGGWFDLESQIGRGTRVTVYLPLASPPVTLPKPTPSASA